MTSRSRRFPLALCAAAPLVLAAVLALSACASDEPLGPCPEVVVLSDAARQVKFEGQGRDLTDILFEADLEAVRLVCSYDDEELDVDLQVRVIASRGPANSDRLANMNYFVAVARSDRTILARRSFDITIPFPGNRTRVSGLEEIGQVITLAPGEDGTNYLIYLGFDLTPEELQFNRVNR